MKDPHLQISEITAYRAGMMDHSRRVATGRHLVGCGRCRDLLPTPTTQEFFNCLLGNDSVFEESRWGAKSRSFVAEVFARRPAIRTVSFAVCLLAVITALTLIFIGNGISPTNDNLIAVVSDEQSGRINDFELFQAPPLDRGTEAIREPPANPKDSVRAGNSHGTPHRVPKKSVNKSPSARNDPEHSESRGVALPCSGRISIGWEASTSKADIRLTWKKVADAVAYGVYLADLDERLIEHYETPDKTSYAVRQPLDPGTIYRWKLVVTLKGGETIVGTSANFKVSDLRSGTSHQANTLKWKREGLRHSSDRSRC